MAHHIPQNRRTEALQFAVLVTYLGHTFEVSNPYAEIQSMYSVE